MVPEKILSGLDLNQNTLLLLGPEEYNAEQNQEVGSETLFFGLGNLFHHQIGALHQTLQLFVGAQVDILLQ